MDELEHKQILLERARIQNELLNEKVKRLEKEHEQLKAKFTDNEIDIINRKNDLNNLLEELQKERRANLVQSQRLQICREQIESINNLIEELKPIKEQLDFKKNVTECLHDLLVKTKLRIAESDDLLQELHDHLTALEYDVEKTKDVSNKGISQWHDEFLAARLREADVNLEFDKIKREVATIKYDLEERMLIREAREQVFGISRDIKKDSLRKQNKSYQMIIEEEEKISARILDLLNESELLKQELKKLENLRGDCEKKIKSNESIKEQLREVRRSIWLREFETNQNIEKLQENYRKLSGKMSEELSKIQSKIDEKDAVIIKIQEKIKNLEIFNDGLEEDIKNNQNADPTIELEEERNSLENEIMRLTKT